MLREWVPAWASAARPERAWRARLLLRALRSRLHWLRRLEQRWAQRPQQLHRQALPGPRELSGVLQLQALQARSARPAQRRRLPCRWLPRSEEHTSELQSPCNLVCRLLLEKKKNKIEAYSRDRTRSRIAVAATDDISDAKV